MQQRALCARCPVQRFSSIRGPPPPGGMEGCQLVGWLVSFPAQTVWNRGIFRFRTKFIKARFAHPSQAGMIEITLPYYPACCFSQPAVFFTGFSLFLSQQPFPVFFYLVTAIFGPPGSQGGGYERRWKRRMTRRMRSRRTPRTRKTTTTKAPRRLMMGVLTSYSLIIMCFIRIIWSTYKI